MVKYDIYSVKCDKEKIYSTLNNKLTRRNKNRELLEGIKWCDNICLDSKEQAEQYLLEESRVDCENLGFAPLPNNVAVRFMVKSEFRPSSALWQMQERLASMTEAYDALNNEPFFADHRREFISCRYCGSKLASAYVSEKNICVVCGKDLRPATLLNRLNKMDTRIKSLRNAIAKKKSEEMDKMEKRAEEYWFVRTAYTTKAERRTMDKEKVV